MRLLVIAVIVALNAIPNASAAPILIESLESPITPETVGCLYSLGTRNFDRIVQVNIALDWPEEDMNIEQTGSQRLVFWNEEAEYLFPKDSYHYQHGSYLVKGYFIVRSGGIHQGVSSIAFMEKVKDSDILLNPNVKVVPAKSCTS